MNVEANVTVTMIRASDGEPFPLYTSPRPEGARRSRGTKTIRADNGDIFYLRITIQPTFRWLESNCLAVRVRYTDSSNNENGRGFEFPRISRPVVPRMITVNLRPCYVWHYEDEKWFMASTRFFCDKVGYNFYVKANTQVYSANHAP